MDCHEIWCGHSWSSDDEAHSVQWPPYSFFGKFFNKYWMDCWIAIKCTTDTMMPRGWILMRLGTPWLDPSRLIHLSSEISQHLPHGLALCQTASDALTINLSNQIRESHKDTPWWKIPASSHIVPEDFSPEERSKKYIQVNLPRFRGCLHIKSYICHSILLHCSLSLPLSLRW